MSDRQNDRPVNEMDREAAHRALARNSPHLDSNGAKYAMLLETLAEFHRQFGSESFELRFNLRVPRDRVEEWNRQYMHGEISQDELRDHLKADAERPIDLEMLTILSDAIRDRLLHFSGVIQEVIPRPREAGTSAWRKQERRIDQHVDAQGQIPTLERKF